MSDILDEAISVKNFLASLGLAKKQEPKEPPQSTLKNKAESVAKSILKEVGVKYHKKSQKKREDGYSFHLTFTHNKKEYLVKCFVIFATGHFSMTLWGEDGQDLMQVVTIGYLPKNARAMEVVGAQRLEVFFAEQK
jgi:hypothetical protein